MMARRLFGGLAVASAIGAAGCAGDRCADVAPSGAALPALPESLAGPQLPFDSYAIRCEFGADGRPTVPIAMEGRGGGRRVWAVLDTGDTGAVTIGGALARLGEPLGPIRIMQSATGPHRVCSVGFDSIAALGAHWSDAVVSANLDRCDDDANIGLAFFEGARGFILDPGSQRLTVLKGSGDAPETPMADQEWAWTPWQSSGTIVRTQELPGRSLTLESELVVEANRPFVIVRVSGEPIPCLVDTGAEGLLLPAAMMPRRTRSVRIRGHGGDVPGRAGRLDGVEFAGRRFDAVKVSSIDPGRLPSGESRELGILGMDLLGRQPVWFDLEGRRLGLGAPSREH